MYTRSEQASERAPLLYTARACMCILRARDMRAVGVADAFLKLARALIALIFDEARASARYVFGPGEKKFCFFSLSL